MRCLATRRQRYRATRSAECRRKRDRIRPLSRPRDTVFALAALGAIAYASPTLAVAPRLRYPGVLRRVAASAGVVLTFDDGPHPRGTPAVLAWLDELGLAATFFVVGEQARRHPSVVREIAAAGHEVALHGYRHLPHALLPPVQVIRDLDRGQRTVEEITGQPIRALRAPFGTASLGTLAFARRRDLVTAGWSRWGWDWTPWATPQSITRSLTSGVSGGDILLLHDSDAYAANGSWRRTVDALAMIADRLDDRGLATGRLTDATCPGLPPEHEPNWRS